MNALRAPRPAGLVLSPDDSAAAAARAVLRFHLRAFASAEPAARAGEVEPVHQLRVATRRLRTALDAKRCRRLLERLAAFADSRAPVGRGTRLGDVAPDLLRPHVRAVVRAGRRLGPDAAPPHLHRFRVRVKRLRYALETLRSLGDRATRELLARLERLQDTLGKGQDAATAIAWLGTYAEGPGVPV